MENRVELEKDVWMWERVTVSGVRLSGWVRGGV